MTKTYIPLEDMSDIQIFEYNVLDRICIKSDVLWSKDVAHGVVPAAEGAKCPVGMDYRELQDKSLLDLIDQIFTAYVLAAADADPEQYVENIRTPDWYLTMCIGRIAEFWYRRRTSLHDAIIEILERPIDIRGKRYMYHIDTQTISRCCC